MRVFLQGVYQGYTTDWYIREYKGTMGSCIRLW